jgi:MFS family permease
MHVESGHPTGEDVAPFAAIRAAIGHDCGVPAAWIVMVLALSGPSLTSLQSAFVSPLASSVANHFGGGDHGALVAQLAVTLPGIGVILGGPVAPWFVRRFGFRWVIAVSAALQAIAGVAGGYIDNVVLFLLTRASVGIASAGLFTAMVSLCGMLFAGRTRGRLLSYQSGISAVITMGATLLSGLIARHFGWHMSFLLYLFTGLYVLLALASPLGGMTTARAHHGAASGGSLRPLLPYLAATVGVYAAAWMAIVQGSLLLSANGFGDPSVQAAVISVSALPYTLTATACAWIEARLFKSWTLAVALAAMAAGVILMGAVPTLWGATLGSFTLGAGSGLSSTYVFRLVIERAPASVRDRAVGLIGPAHYVGQLANPAVVHSLRLFIGIQGAFVAVGALLVASAGLAARYRASATKPE